MLSNTAPWRGPPLHLVCPLGQEGPSDVLPLLSRSLPTTSCVPAYLLCEGRLSNPRLSSPTEERPDSCADPTRTPPGERSALRPPALLCSGNRQDGVALRRCA